MIKVIVKTEATIEIDNVSKLPNGLYLATTDHDDSLVAGEYDVGGDWYRNYGKYRLLGVHTHGFRILSLDGTLLLDKATRDELPNYNIIAKLTEEDFEDA